MGLARKFLNLFCRDNNSDVGIFGSKYNGSPLSSTDPDSIQDLSNPASSWLSGWSKAVVSSQAPCMEDMNGVMYVLSYMTKYLYQTGIPEWNSDEDYNLYALTQYGGVLYFCLSANSNQNPSSSPSYWRPLKLTASWVAGTTYSVGDIVNYNGKTYRCAVGNTSNPIFETDFYAGYWDDGNSAGTLIQSIAWSKTTNPYRYFDVTGSNAGQEISISTYGELYEIIGTAYNNCVNYNTGVAYGDPASGNFRLPDFRNTFFKNAGSNTRGAGHNASHTHSHNRGSSINLTHNHTTYGGNVPASNAPTNLGNIGVPLKDSAIAVPTESYKVFGVPSIYSTILTSVTNTTSLSIPALSISNQGSGSSPEPNYYGLKILLKY